jgi:hypothetical protein
MSSCMVDSAEAPDKLVGLGPSPWTACVALKAAVNTTIEPKKVVW